MNIETVNEKVKACKFVGHENIIEVVEGDAIVPDIKPDILSLVHVDGNVLISHKEVVDGKVKIDGGVEIFALYIAEDEKASIKGLNALLNFSESIDVPEAKAGMWVVLHYKLIGMEHRVVNSRKMSVKCSIEMDIKVIGDEEIEVTKDLVEPGSIQYQKANKEICELVGASCQSVDIKENVMLENKPPISEILKTKLEILNCNYKISYNKILVKADLRVNTVYVADNDEMSLECFETLLPVAGFIDMNGVTDKDAVAIDTVLSYCYCKPVYQDLKANGINVEAKVEMCARVYRKKTVEVLTDLYNPVYEMTIENKKVELRQNMDARCEELDLSQVISVTELSNATIFDMLAVPTISEMKKVGNKTNIDGNVNLDILYYDREKKKMEMKKIELPFQKTIEPSCTDVYVQITNLGYTLQNNGQLDLKLVLRFVCEDINILDLNLITKIEQTETRSTPVASLVIYYVQPGDSLWKIAKKFKTTVERIKVANQLKDDMIYPGTQLIIPKIVPKVITNPLL